MDISIILINFITTATITKFVFFFWQIKQLKFLQRESSDIIGTANRRILFPFIYFILFFYEMCIFEHIPLLKSLEYKADKYELTCQVWCTAEVEIYDTCTLLKIKHIYNNIYLI